ncbi:MAG TPA: dihydropteroate synthase [Solirubrobacteraceae bacterium]|nr:dihydropteroate synthase [Solirubrobacteraceae bacterium]
MAAPARRLETSDGALELGGERRPLVTGIVNATPDSFSDAGLHQTLPERVALAAAQLADGAALIDIGGESGTTDRPPVSAEEEIARVVPVIRAVRSELGARISVDTYKPAVARAAIAAGASIVNDVSGLRDPELADVCAQTGAALVLMHTIAPPKQRLHDRALDGRIVGEVRRFLGERIELALARGVRAEQLLLDPGPDFSKTPAQSIDVLRSFETLHELERPLLLAVSRKDFVGALTGRGPRERLAGTLGAVAHGVRMGAHVLRLHDVAAACDFLTVLRALEGADAVDPAVQVDDRLRWARGDAGTRSA